MGWNKVNTVFYYKSFGCVDSFFCMNKKFFLKGGEVIILLPQVCVNLMYTLNEWIFRCMFV